MYYEENLSKCKSKQDRFLKSQKFLKQSAKWQKVVECIFQTIIASPYLYCSKSNRTISEETGVSLFVVNQVRLWLESEKVIQILRLKNGKRANKRFVMQMNCSVKLEIKKMNWYERERYACIMGLTVEELTQASLNDLKNFNLHRLSKTEQEKEIADIENRGVYDSSTKDLSTFDKGKFPINNKVKSNMAAGAASELVEIVGKDISEFNSFEFTEKAEILESVGIMTVPTDGKKVYCGYDSLVGKGRLGRLDLINRVDLAGRSAFSSDFYRERMGSVAYDKFREITFGNTKWVNRLKYFDKKFEHYKNYDSLAIVMRENMLCIDIDSKDYRLLGVIEEIVNGCLVQETPRGFHIFVRDTKGVLAGLSGLGLNVDIKRYKSHVVVADKEGKYKFLRGNFRSIPDLPEDFLSKVAYSMHTDPIDLMEMSIKAFDSIYSSDSKTDYTGKFQLPDYLFVGERNYTCMRYSFYLRAKGYTLDAIEKILRDYIFDRKRVEEPLKECEIRGIMRHVYRKPNNKDFIQFVPMFSVEI